MSVIHRYSGSELATDPADNLLVTSAGSESAQVWQLGASTNWGATPAVSAGLMRLRLRLKRPAGVHSLTLRTYSAGQPTDWEPITSADLLEAGAWYEITREVRFYGPGYFFAIIGNWPGLQVDWIQTETLDEVYLAGIATDRLRYLPGQPGTVTARLVNTTTQPQAITVRVTRESGFGDTQEGAAQNLTLPVPSSAQRIAGTDETTVTLTLPHLVQWGNGIRVDVEQAGAVVTTLREFCYCTDDALQASPLYWGWQFINSYTDINALDQIAKMRRLYALVSEFFFWAPCDNSNLAPTEDKWRSGQTRRRVGKAPLQAGIASLHALGMLAAAYATRWGFGWRMWLEFARHHPDLVEWYLGAVAILSYHVGQLEAQRAADQGENDALASTGMLPAAWGNPAAVAYHAAQLAASVAMFGWDLFRYDNGFPIIDLTRDCRGRSLPLSGWTSGKALAALRAGMAPARYGGNIGWNVVTGSLPYADDPYTQQVGRKGYALQEGETNGTFRPFGPWAAECALLALAGRKARQFGGDQVCITDPTLSGDDRFFQNAMVLAAGCKIAYSAPDEHRPLMQLACRHGDLFFSQDLKVAPSGVFRVSAPLLWDCFAGFVADSNRKRRYVLHLFNPPAGNMGAGLAAPPPVDNVQVTCVLPTGWKATAAHALTPDGGYSLTDLDLTQLARGRYRVTLPRLHRYTVVVVEATGPAEPETRESLANASRSPRAQLTNPDGVLGTSTALDYTDPTAEPVTRRASEFTVAGSTLVTLPSGSTALRLGNSSLNLGHAPGIPRPGRYRLTVRAKSLVTPPTGASLTGMLQSALNGKTPSANPTSAFTTWSRTAFPVNQWVEVTLDGLMGYPNYWCVLTGGWNGLVLDTIKIERVAELDRDVLAATITDRWPDGQTVNTASTVAFVAAGLYYAESGIPAALQARGLTPTLGKAENFRGELSLTPPFPSSADDLAGYRVIVLSNVEAAQLQPEQVLWLDHYARGGGIVVCTGGPYGFGGGGWGDSPLTAGLLPVTVARGDLQPVSGPLVPVSTLAQGVSWTSPPNAAWANAFTAKDGATVELRVGTQPVAVSWALGSGRVLALGLHPGGVISAPYWDWAQWAALLGKLVMGS